MTWKFLEECIGTNWGGGGDGVTKETFLHGGGTWVFSRTTHARKNTTDCPVSLNAVDIQYPQNLKSVAIVFKVKLIYSLIL